MQHTASYHKHYFFNVSSKSNNNHHGVEDHDDRHSAVKMNNNKKSVRFAKNLVQACEATTPKPSKEEKHLLYYSKQELKAIKEEIVITVKLARRSSKEILKQSNKNSSGTMSSTVDDMMMITSEIILCTRGLEHIIDSDLAKERRTRISKVRETIMLVQVANFYENPIVDHFFESSSSSSSISCSCRSWTRKSQKEAYIRGLADRAMVDMDGFSSIMTSTKPSSTKKKKGKKIVAPLKHSSREIAKSLSSLNLRNKESSKQSLVVVRAPSA